MRIRNFLRDESGLVAIEWVGIAAVAFVAAVVIAGAIMTGANDLGGAVAGQMSAEADVIDPPTP